MVAAHSAKPIGRHCRRADALCCCVERAARGRSTKSPGLRCVAAASPAPVGLREVHLRHCSCCAAFAWPCGSRSRDPAGRQKGALTCSSCWRCLLCLQLRATLHQGASHHCCQGMGGLLPWEAVGGSRCSHALALRHTAKLPWWWPAPAVGRSFAASFVRWRVSRASVWVPAALQGHVD